MKEKEGVERDGKGSGTASFGRRVVHTEVEDDDAVVVVEDTDGRLLFNGDEVDGVEDDAHDDEDDVDADEDGDEGVGQEKMR